MDSASPLRRPLRVRKICRLLQPSLKSGADLAQLPGLDPKLWVALASPAKGLEFDPRTLELIDGDGDGRIRRQDLINAVEWTLAHITSPAVLDDPAPVLALDQLDTSTPGGMRLHASAMRILKNLGKPGATDISLEDALSGDRILAAARSNGDGIIAPSTARNEEERAAIAEVMACGGTVKDRSGSDGIGTAQIATFWGHLAAWLAWIDAGVQPIAAVRDTLGGDPVQAFSAYSAVRGKIDTWFAQARIAQFDPQAVDALNKPLREWAGFAGRPAVEIEAALRELPLAEVRPGASLPLAGKVNPAWADALGIFHAKVASGLCTQVQALDSETWTRIQAIFQPYETWLAAKPPSQVETLGEARARELLSSDLRQRLEALVANDLSIAHEIDDIALVEKLLRFKRDLLAFANNFVAFPDFYSQDRHSVFQTGTLYFDARALHFCVSVDDAARHSVLAGKGGLFLIYCDLRRGADKRTIAAAVTAGSATRIFPGRNGVFYDRDAREWDATVVRVIENPISLKQAAIAPFIRIGTLIGSQFERLSAAREAAFNKTLTEKVTEIDKRIPATPPGNVPPANPAPEQTAAERRAGMGSLLAGGGVAVAALSTSLAFVTSTLSKVEPIYFLYTIILFVLVIVAPSVLLAWLKLRRRDVGMILEAGGWAINGQIPLNARLANSLTARVPLAFRLSPGRARPLQHPVPGGRTAPQG